MFIKDNTQNIEWSQYLKNWEEQAQVKIVLKVNNLLDLINIQNKATQLNIPTYVVCDLGRTQVQCGSITVCAIGPGPQEIIDKLTETLKLY